MFTILPPTQDQLIEIMREICGGADVVEMLAAYHEGEARDRKTYREIAASHHSSVEVVHRLMARARVRLRRCGLMPESWERQPPKSKRPISAS